MAETNEPIAATGEQRLRDRRRSFWTYAIGGILLALPVGLCVGYLTRQGRDGVYSPAAAVIAMAAAVVIFAWYTIGYYRRVDELDLADNLWAGFIALHLLLVAYPCWVMLHFLGLTSAPSAEALWFGTFAATFLAYGWRKLRAL